MSVYKGDKLLDASTDATEAVSLGNEKLFQSYIICSEYEVSEANGIETKLTYGKIGAGIYF